MKGQVFIKHLDYIIGEEKYKFADHLDYFADGKAGAPFETPEKFMELTQKYLGIDSVNIATTSQEDMTMQLVQKAIDEKKIDPATLKFIFIGVDTEDQLVNFGHRLQFEMKMPKAKVIRIAESYCANIDMAIGIAKQFLEDYPQPSDALVIAGNKQDGATWDQRLVGSYAVMGDGAAIAVLSNSPEGALLEVVGQDSVNKGQLYHGDFTKDNTILHFQGYTESTKALFAQLGITGADIDCVILHNANQLLVTESLKSLKVTPDKIDKTNHTKFGHLGTCDLLINLKTHLDHVNGKPEKILSVNLGVAGIYVATLFKK